ncbi:hypothetical protein RYX36_022110 [Vicia faba]
MWWIRVIWALLLSFWVLLQQSSCIEEEHSCRASSCGKISNISYPFRLKHDPKHCGDSRYELSCENDVTTLYLCSGKYHVQSINYHNFTITLLDPGLELNNCSSLPINFLSRFNFFDDVNQDNTYCTDPYQATLNNYGNDDDLLFEHIVYLNCSHQVTNNHKYVDTSSCINSHSINGHSYIYAMAGDLIAKDFQVGCQVKLVAPTSGFGLQRNQLLPYHLMHNALAYGFMVSWVNLVCKTSCGESNPCSFNATTEKFHCSDDCGYIYMLHTCGLFGILNGQPRYRYEDFYCPEYIGFIIGQYVLPSILVARFMFVMTLFIGLLIYKWRKRHLSMFGYIEVYLQQQNNLTPIGYSYKEIKKMVRGFKDKLGEGGFGTVFKGNLRSGPCVAIKMLRESKGNGHDFISEVATIGRIHHLNVVQLIGFCAEGSKCALVYDFMPNGSLDKFIFSKEGSASISYSQIFDISVGVARGIAYLHHGCEMKILHFDIKPHNILLDENFIPKVSDFGLAKLYPVENSIVTMTAARGTIGYMAPELFYKNIGGVSYKADVYSFGMLLMEMASKRKNLNVHAEHSSQLYFPLWIYDQVENEHDIEIEDISEDEKKMVKKMIIVALWCIQLKPDDRPSMSKVVEMLEGDIETLNMPPKPILYPNETIGNDQRSNSDQTMSSDSVEIATDSLIENVS